MSSLKFYFFKIFISFVILINQARSNGFTFLILFVNKLFMLNFSQFFFIYYYFRTIVILILFE